MKKLAMITLVLTAAALMTSFCIPCSAEQEFYEVHEQVQSREKEVFVTPRGIKYHQKGCRYLRSDAQKLNYSKAVQKGYVPCRQCC